MEETRHFYEYILEEHKSQINTIRYRKMLLASLNKRFELLKNLPQILDNCSICLEKMNRLNITKTKCGHYFHFMCLDFWKSRNAFKKCPLCRYDLLIPSTAVFRWNIKESKNNQENSILNTHVDLKKTDNEDGTVEFCFKLIISGGMGSTGKAEYTVIY